MFLLLLLLAGFPVGHIKTNIQTHSHTRIFDKTHSTANPPFAESDQTSPFAARDALNKHHALHLGEWKCQGPNRQNVRDGGETLDGAFGFVGNTG